MRTTNHKFPQSREMGWFELVVSMNDVGTYHVNWFLFGLRPLSESNTKEWYLERWNPFRYPFYSWHWWCLSWRQPSKPLQLVLHRHRFGMRPCHRPPQVSTSLVDQKMMVLLEIMFARCVLTTKLGLIGYPKLASIVLGSSVPATIAARVCGRSSSGLTTCSKPH